MDRRGTARAGPAGRLLVAGAALVLSGAWPGPAAADGGGRTPPPDTVAVAGPAPGGTEVPGAMTRAPRAMECQLCHASLELLRQQAPSLERARELHVPRAGFLGSAHGDRACGECHRGYDGFPHREEGASTEACGSCHAPADSAWAAGAHAGGDDGAERSAASGSRRPPATGPGPEETARCVDCHGTHTVASVDRLREEAGVRALNERCLSCHATERLPAGAPHADSVACHACHRPHDVQHVDTPEAAVAPARQVRTCGVCHDSIAGRWREDVHGTAVRERTPPPERGGGEGEGAAPEERALAAQAGEEGGEPTPPACTTCHGAHGMSDLSAGGPPGADVARCDDCHEEYADTFGDSYHGQAVSLGSPAAASCVDCHTAHAIHPASDARSSVAPENLIDTCGDCHEDVTPAFVQFQPHADPHDREKNPVLYWSYKFMTFLLVGVMAVFGLHTLLWLLRLGIERVRGPGGPAGRDVGGEP